jgi:DNA-binding IclR family transcriptional regulator
MAMANRITARQGAALNALDTRIRIATAQLAEATGTSPADARRTAISLVRLSLIVQHGSPGRVSYTLTAKGKAVRDIRRIEENSTQSVDNIH